MPDHRIVQGITLLIALIGTWRWVLRVRRDRSYLLFAIPPLSILIHVALFYTAILIDNPPTGTRFYTWWSSVIRLQSTILIAVLAWYRITRK